MLNTRIDRNTTCNFCGTNIRVTPDSVKRVDMPLELNELGEEPSVDPVLTLTVFTCKICGNSTVKTVDDIISQGILKQCLKTQLKGEKLKSRGMCLNGADLKKLSKLSRKLDDRRKVLYEQYREQVDQFVLKLDESEPSHTNLGEKE